MKCLNKKNAFTLMEVLVSIAIFVIILSVVLVNYGYSAKVNGLRLLAYDIEDSIKFTQNMSFTGQKINDIIPNNGYGIYINKADNSYTIYGDRGNQGFDINDLQYSTARLPSNVVINNIMCTDAKQYVDINFIAPRGSMKIYNGGIEHGSCYINIKNTRISGSWDIRLESSTARIWTEFNNN